MKKLLTFALNERSQAGLLKELLEREGIHCLIRNDQLFSAMGEIPFLECLPELWIVDNEVYPRARQLLKNWLHEEEQAGKETWRCPRCGERHEGQFGACWQCGELREK
ncbi:MAG TPA: DUF2007 domain-containing protein [Desulfuromonadales bacterium]|nr:DUF2007 domain-containing protein [Desulfuromonadales bacterium]